MKLSKKTILQAVLFAASLLILLFPAIINGYVFLHGDSGVNIAVGFKHFVPIERPIFYGLFIELTSLRISLWLVAIAQSLLTAFVIHVVALRIFGDKYHPFIPFFIILFLSLTSSCAYFVCQMKPDFFLPLMVLAFFTILTGKKKPGPTDIILIAILVAGLISHHSHLPILAGLSFSVIILVIILRKKPYTRNLLTRAVLLFVIVTGSWLLALSVNYYFLGKFQLSRVKNIIYTSRLIQAGVFQEYVNDRCREDTTFTYCKYKDELVHYKTYFDYLWDDSSFLYDHPCREKGKQLCWVARNEEFGRVNSDILHHSKYVRLFVINAIKTSLVQLTSFDIPVYASYHRHSFPKEMTEKFLPVDKIYLEKSIQSDEQLEFRVQNKIQLIIVILSLLFIGLAYLIKRIRSLLIWEIRLMGIIILLSLAGNAFFLGLSILVIKHAFSDL